MKLKLTILLVILSLFAFCHIDKSEVVVCDGIDVSYDFDSAEYERFSQADNFVDLFCRQVSAKSISFSQTLVKKSVSRRDIVNILHKLNLTTSTILSESGCSYNVNSPFNINSQKELLFILCNIRI